MQEKKVFVGLSGGVDSSVSAALLKEHGYDVTGVFIKVWHPDFLPCEWENERLDAMRVCANLDIPFRMLDLEEQYKKEVADYLIEEYRGGRTPNPDVMCNKSIKFGGFFDYAMKEKADYIATGHYARINNQNSSYQLLAGKDTEKDQSYFLWTLTQEHLAHTLFPIGGYEKKEVREIARKFDLPTAEKKDSQGVCFLGKLDMKEFLRHYIPAQKGNVLNKKGEVVGEHDGALFYTLGQRHGFTVTKKAPDDGAHYIVARDIDTNTITVSTDPVRAFPKQDKKTVHLEKTNWINEKPINEKRYQARLRYRQPLSSCTLQADASDTATVIFENPQTVIPAGQSLVVYDREICLGGGIITYPNT